MVGYSVVKGDLFLYSFNVLLKLGQYEDSYRFDSRFSKIVLKCHKINVGKFSYNESTAPWRNNLDSTILNPWSSTVEELKNRLM